MDFFKKIDTDYDYRDYTHAKIQIALATNFKFDDVCLDIEIDVILIDREFFKAQTSTISIRTMTTSLKIRDLDTTKYQSFEYAIVDIYLSSTRSTNDEKINALIRREIYLIDNLKANMLIENDIIDLEKIVIDMHKRETLITSCEITIFLEIKTQSDVVNRSVPLRKTTIIPSRIEMSISIHYTNIFNSRDFLFESEKECVSLALYAHMIDVFTRAILVRNDKEQLVRIRRNQRLDRVSKINFSNVFLIDSSDESIHQLAIQELKIVHQNK